MAWSQDGGQTWSPATDEASQPDPTCQASLLRIDDGATSRFYFLNPAGKGRANGTLRRSDDGGKTWTQSTLLFPGPFAYSSMAPVKGGLGVLYEPNSNTTVLYRRVALETAPGR